MVLEFQTGFQARAVKPALQTLDTVVTEPFPRVPADDLNRLFYRHARAIGPVDQERVEHVGNHQDLR